MKNKTACSLALFIVLVALCSVRSAQAAVILTIDLGTTQLLPNTAGQQVQFFIRNDGDTAFNAQGATLNFEVDNGDTGVNPAPIITGLDIKTGTLWAGAAASGQTVDVNNDEFASATIVDLFTGGIVLPSGGASFSIGTVTFDTSGLTSGSWDFRMGNFVSSGSPSLYVEFGSGTDFFPNITNGTLTVVPEPHEYALIASLGLLGWAVVRKRRTKAAPARA